MIYNVNINGSSDMLEANINGNSNGIGMSKSSTYSAHANSSHHQHPSITNRVGGKLSFNMMLEAARKEGVVRNKNDTVLKANGKKRKIKKTHPFVIGNPNGHQTTNNEHSSEYSTESAKIADIGEKLGYIFDTPG